MVKSSEGGNSSENTEKSTSKQKVINSRVYTPARMRRRARMLEQSKKENYTLNVENLINSLNAKGLGDGERRKSDLALLSKGFNKSFEKKIFSPSNTIMTPVNLNSAEVQEKLNFQSSITSRPYVLSDNSLYGSINKTTSIYGSRTSLSTVGSAELHEIQPISGFLPNNLTKDYEKIKILATLLPDQILSDPTSRKLHYYNTAVLFPDVSGFTQLCEKYDKTGKGGPSRLTEVLNGYLGSMIQIVLSRNGDVFKFGGDAFFCVWKVPVNGDIRNIVYLAIESAIDIQKNCGEHETDVGVKLGVKVAVAAGKAIFSIIGTDSRKHYVIFGTPVIDVRDAELLCKSGDVIVAPSAWRHVENYMLYSYTYHSNNTHIRVHDFGPLWKPTTIPYNNISSENEHDIERLSLKFITRLKTEELRPFILTPVMKSIDLNQSLNYLTEMRQVAIVFFNVVVDLKNTSAEDYIKLSHKAFVIVCTAVDKTDGAVNKLTLFDKDMAILAVFGLKGFKHELASQVALKCAYNCVEQLKKLPIMSASAGVTTGMAYCGVIGHLLRKEYTVMGRSVNMAARLMCAYPNIVSLDRDSFLHSKLESGHFEVLEQKFLKGVDNKGPFYKFNLKITRSKLKLDYNTYPLLGRGKEIMEFEKLLGESMRRISKINFMVIYGTARIGKSRLIAGFINIAEKQNYLNEQKVEDKRIVDKSRNLDIIIILLTEDDSKSSYSAIRLLFQQPLGLNESSLIEEREDKIVSKLGDFKDVSLLPALNPIFNVNFDLTPQYLSLTVEEQMEAQNTLTNHLYKNCFLKGTKWLVFIDDAEFMDDESWVMLKWCAHLSYSVFYVLTVGQRRILSPAALEALASFNQKKIDLGEIEKWYYSGMACQILGVVAIPVELENLMQKFKNSGNPGWLESFLITLLQSGNIYISQIAMNEIKKLGLITAPDEMLSSAVMANENEKYESSYWLDCVENFELHKSADFQKVNVCLLGPNFFLDNKTGTDLTMDTMFIKTIDGLKPIEQLVLKVGSVLGNNFRRTALAFVMSKDSSFNERFLAKAIKTLFDMKILTCAKGDLNYSNILAPRRMILVTAIRKEITCECSGLEIPALLHNQLESCQDLPQYANCGYMQFRSPIFRETVYSLLLDDQKKKYHISSIDYFRTHTNKCKSCDNAPFEKIIGINKNDEMVLVCNISPMHGVRTTNVNPRAGFPLLSIGQKCLLWLRIRSANVFRKTSQVDVEFGRISGALGDCQCSEILASVYSILLEHAAGSGRKDILLEVQLEYASLTLTTYNIPLTMQILEDALALANQMKEEKEYPNFCTPYIFSKIYTLMGATKLNMGRTHNSLELLKTGLKYLKFNFPESKDKIKFLTKQQDVKRKIMTEYFPQKFIGTCSDQKASCLDLLSECMGLISVVHMYMQNWLMAKYASAVALNKALESNRNFYGLCVAYTNMIDVAYHYKDLNTCAKMEICAVDLCRRCRKKIIEIYELEAIGRLYRVIFQARHMRAEIENAVFIGFQSIKIASVIRSTSLRLDLMPDLIFALIQLNRLPEAVSLLQELEFMSQVDSDKSSRIWYYAICLDFQLDTGFTVIPYETCQTFVKEEENFASVRDVYSKHRLFTCLWLWSIRHSEWEVSKSYANTLKGFKILDATETPSTVFTRLKRLEGILISLVHRMDTKNIHAVTSAYLDIHTLMGKLKKDIQVVKVLKPRYLLLKAYYRQIKYRDDSCFRILNQARNLADKMNDKNTCDWINHLKMVWNNTISPIQRDFWIEHCRYNLIDWHECDGQSKKQSVMYSLPLPKF